MPTATEDWKMIAIDAPNFTPAILAARAQRFDSKVRSRNLREYAASALVVAFFGFRMLTAAAAIDRVASGLVVLAAVWTVLLVRRGGTPVEPNPAAPAELQRRDWKAELERQRRLLRSVRWTYIAPFVPGFTLFALAPLVKGPADSGAWLASVLTFALFAGMLWIIDRLNRKAADELGRTIAALD